jgi:glutamyl-tRNA synthetase
MAERGSPLADLEAAALAAAIPLVKDGAKTVLDLPALAEFAIKRRPIHLDEKTRTLLSPDAVHRLGRLRKRLADGEWTPETLDAQIRSFVADEGVKLGEIGPVLRGVLTGGTPSPDLARTLFALRRDEALGRIDDALSRPA